MKCDLKTRPINECRCDERLKTNSEESTRLVYTRLLKNECVLIVVVYYKSKARAKESIYKWVSV